MFEMTDGLCVFRRSAGLSGRWVRSSLGEFTGVCASEASERLVSHNGADGTLDRRRTIVHCQESSKNRRRKRWCVGCLGILGVVITDHCVLWYFHI
ncbi:hypothetical protein QBC32DRAFT_317075 [Pseudoneurospora amorphoporcata]|uniref:Uncharacterized protein n=1 Tax=Pseudoneurospora amorphoporcata TaxID=241081 RepID=A0AAN6SDH8_9PEZI|nr:hypothetical protein QBC32DRAFT_317075 [Pseudoneurospora amorphoporcata]